MSASQELEQFAIKAATEAIQLESQGLRKMAVPRKPSLKEREATDTYLKILKLPFSASW